VPPCLPGCLFPWSSSSKFCALSSSVFITVTYWYWLQEEVVSAVLWYCMQPTWGVRYVLRLWSARIWHSVIWCVVTKVSEECADLFISTEGSETEKVVGCVGKRGMKMHRRAWVWPIRNVNGRKIGSRPWRSQLVRKGGSVSNSCLNGADKTMYLLQHMHCL